MQSFHLPFSPVKTHKPFFCRCIPDVLLFHCIYVSFEFGNSKNLCVNPFKFLLHEIIICK